MSDTLTLSAGARERAGKGASRAMRREGRVPAVIYGARRDPVAIHVEEKALVRALSTGHFMNTVTMIALDGGRTTRTLPKDVQFHPVSDRPLHVDFFRIDEHSQVTVAVPVRFTDEEEAPGLERGGVLNVVRHELEISCEAGSIPAEIAISLKGLEVGGSIHISDVTLPEGVTSAIDDRDFTIATVVAPSAMKAEEQAIAAEEEAAAEAESAEAAVDGEAPAGESEAE